MEPSLLTSFRYSLCYNSPLLLFLPLSPTINGFEEICLIQNATLAHKITCSHQLGLLWQIFMLSVFMLSVALIHKNRSDLVQIFQSRGHKVCSVNFGSFVLILVISAIITHLTCQIYVRPGFKWKFVALQI